MMSSRRDVTINLEHMKPKKPSEIPQPGKNPETVPAEEPEPKVWPRKEPEINPGKEPLTIPPSKPLEIPAPPESVIRFE